MSDTISFSKDQFDALMQSMADVQAAAQRSAAGNPTNDEAAQAALYENAMRLKYGKNGAGANDALANAGIGVQQVEIMEDKPLPTDPAKLRKAFRAQLTEDRAYRTLATMPDEIQILNDDAYLLKSYADAHRGGVYGVNPQFDIRRTDTWRELQDRVKALPEVSKTKLVKSGFIKKAMDSATSAEGAEYIPTGFSDQVHMLYRLERKVAGLINEFNMPTNPFKWPIENSDATAYLAGESTSDTATKYTASTPGTGNTTFTAVLFAARILFSGELEEDSIIAVAPYVYQKLALAHTEAVETALINGDTTGTHQDSDTTSAADARKAWKGFRKLALGVASNGASLDLSTFSTANLRLLRQKAGKYGIKMGSLAWIASIASYYKMLGLTEVLTLQNYGPMATVLQGELGKFDSIPIIVSEYQRQDLNASGVYDGVTTTKTALSLVNRDEYMIGRRRAANVVTDRSLYLETGQVVTVATQRMAFQPMLTVSATNPTAVIGYNI